MLDYWAARWTIPPAALAELKAHVLGLECTERAGPHVASPGTSEAAVQAQVRLEASRKGMRLWRNNVGAFTDPETNQFVRFGLANDSKQLNMVIKSGDLIGIRPWVVQPGDVGRLIGQFVSREVKRAGWKYAGSEREVAQLNWVNLVNSLGGDAKFCTGEGSL
jgi:hypothetical protein